MITFSECFKKNLYFLEMELRFFFGGGPFTEFTDPIGNKLSKMKGKDPVQGNERKHYW